MCLQTDAVDFDATSFQRRNQGKGGSGFRTRGLDVVVIVVELYVRVIQGCGFERDGDVFWADLETINMYGICEQSHWSLRY